MPELPEVETICRQLREKVESLTFTNCHIYRPDYLRGQDAGEFVNQVKGSKVLTLSRRGKYILWCLDRGTVLSHLGMTGNYLLLKEVSIILPHSIALFKFDGISIILRDIRRFGSLDFYASNQVIPKIEKLGTEPLSEGFSYKCLADKLSGRKRAVKETLIDQTIIAGLGNIYASEILFKARVHPSVPSGRLSQSKIKRIVDSTKEILNLAIEKAGTTISDYKTPDSKSGDFQNFLQVYGKANKPCSTCGSLIQRAVINQRSTFFCPRCQKI